MKINKGDREYFWLLIMFVYWVVLDIAYALRWYF